jgi:F-type H+-transporting ATPase subunit b
MKMLRTRRISANLSVWMFCAALAMGVAATQSAHATAPAAQKASSSEATAPNGVVPAKEEQEKDENYEYTHSPMVQKLGRMLGMSPDTASTTFTVLNFVLLMLGVGYLVLKMLPKAFRQRSSAIQKHLVDARTATEEAQARLNSVEARLAKLDDQIVEMKKQAEADLGREEKRIQSGLEEEQKKIVDAAEAEIIAATAAARREIQNYAAELAIDQAAKKLVVTAETDRLLVENFARRLGAEVGGEN